MMILTCPIKEFKNRKEWDFPDSSKAKPNEERCGCLYRIIRIFLAEEQNKHFFFPISIFHGLILSTLNGKLTRGIQETHTQFFLESTP